MRKKAVNLITVSLIWALCCCNGTKEQDPKFMENLPYYVENLEVFGLNQEPGRAFHIPERNISLNGTWKFNLYENPLEVPKNFFKSSFNDRKWGTIDVPSNWEMQGYGQAMFRNVAAPFPNGQPLSMLERYQKILDDPDASEQQKRMAQNRMNLSNPFAVRVPNVPMDVNPTGAYRTEFTIPSDWKGDEVFLRFEKVASGSFVWVNGKQVGYNEGAQEPSEYVITPYIKSGKNTLAVMVLKFCDGYYLEGQDYWRLAGIFDDVTIYSTPKVRIYDWYVTTDFGPDFVDSDLKLAMDVRSYGLEGSGYKVKATVSKDGREVANMEDGPFNVKDGTSTINLSAKVKAPKKWTSETPELYDLTMDLIGPDGKTVDHIVKRMGFKKTEIRDGVFYLNGQPLKVNAQNSHMQHPILGHAMDEATIRRDMEILKQFNFNGVRTSHYPPVNEYLDLADEYGLYIIDETGDEAHATEYVSNMPEFIEMYRERVRQMVLRDRNHACVLFWSAGNESGEGDDIREVVEEGKRYDATRYWMYGGNAAVHPAEDIVGPRYPSPEEHERRYGRDTRDMRPSFMDEYLSVAGNGGGGLDDYWRVIYSYPKLMGGALWDFVSPGLEEPVRLLKDQSPYKTPAHIMGRATLEQGPTGKALDLHKQEQWVQVYRADNVEISGNKLTLTLDIYPRLFNRSGGYLICKGSNQYGLKQQGAERLDFYIDNGRRQTLSAPLPEDWENRWHNVTAVYDGSEMKIFIDGTQVASQATSGKIRNLPLSLCIGRDEQSCGQDANPYICDAMIDNVGVFADAVLPGSFDPAKAALWLDFEEEQNQGTFYTYGQGARTYGSIWPDRVPQPEMWQMKKTVQPLSFTLVDLALGHVEVWNRNHFTNASIYNTKWSLMADDKVIESGTLNLDVEPLTKKMITIPFHKPARIEPGKEYRLEISSSLKKDEVWAKAGHEVAWDQFELESWYTPLLAGPVIIKRNITLTQGSNSIVVSGQGFSYRFNAVSGALESMNVDGKEMLKSPVTLNVWRAPVANEIDGWNGSGAGQPSIQGYGNIGANTVLASHYYAASLDKRNLVPVSVKAFKGADVVVIDVKENSLSTNGTDNRFENDWHWVVNSDGTVTVHHKVKPMGKMPQWLPRIGVTMSLDKSLSKVEWYGRGPQASYPDRKTGYRVGIYNTTVNDMYEPYLIPQDYGLRTDNRWVRLTDNSGKGLEFSMNQYFNFNAYDCTTDNLTKAIYQYQLQRGGDITLNLDYATSGVGCTARGIFNQYRVLPQPYQRLITIKPLR